MTKGVNIGRFVTTIDLSETPLKRDGEVEVTVGIRGWYYPATYWEPEDRGEEIDYIEFSKGLTGDEEAVLCEWVEDNWDDIYNPDMVDWREPYDEL